MTHITRTSNTSHAHHTHTHTHIPEKRPHKSERTHTSHTSHTHTHTNTSHTHTHLKKGLDKSKRGRTKPPQRVQIKQIIIPFWITVSPLPLPRLLLLPPTSLPLSTPVPRVGRGGRGLGRAAAGPACGVCVCVCMCVYVCVRMCANVNACEDCQTSW